MAMSFDDFLAKTKAGAGKGKVGSPPPFTKKGKSKGGRKFTGTDQAKALRATK